MSTLRLKLVGLNGIDRNSLRSMLRLSADLLTSEWILVEEGQADLEIYAFDTDSGQQAWQNRGLSYTALLTNTGNVSEPVDIVLRKPLLKSSFSEALNLVEEKIRLQNSEQQVDRPPERIEASHKWTARAAKWFDTLKLRKQPCSQLPQLDLRTPASGPLANRSDTIKDPGLLLAWLNQLPKEANQRTSTLLSNIIVLSQLRLKPLLMLQLLEIYRTEIHALLFTRDISAVKRDMYATPENLRAIHNISELIATLGLSYQQLAHHPYQRGATPDHNSLLLFCLNRSAEQQALLILHAYQYYRKAPAGSWHWLHQQYLYQEQAQTLMQTVSLREQHQSRSFYDLYLQITLTALADPYSLARFDVIRLFRLMTEFTDKVETGTLSNKLINSTSNFMLTGHFCIDTDSDLMPQAMVKMPPSVRQRPSTRLLNTQPALLYIENLFKDAKSGPYASLDTELRLLKKIIPQLNTTHERRYHRLNSAKHRTAIIVQGISYVHQSLQAEKPNGLNWHLANQGSGGIMAKRATRDCYHLNIGDFVGIFEPGVAVKLASVRWLFVDTQGDTVIGLELIEGKPVPVFCTPDGEAEQHPALIMPTTKPKEPAAMITEKGLYSPRRRLRVKDHGEPYIAEASGIIDSTLDYELFNFTIKQGS